MGTLWPGTIRGASASNKNGGAKTVVFLEFLGDIGYAIGPTYIGFFADASNIQTVMLLGIAFPVMIVIFLIYKYGRK